MTLDELKSFAAQIGENANIQSDKANIRATIIFDIDKLHEAVFKALKEGNGIETSPALNAALHSTKIEVVGFAYTYEKLILQCRDVDYIETAAGLLFDMADGIITVKEVLFPCFGVIKGLNGNSIEQAFIDVFNGYDRVIKAVDMHSLIEDTNTNSFVDAWRTIFVHKSALDLERYNKLNLK